MMSGRRTSECRRPANARRPPLGRCAGSSSPNAVRCQRPPRPIHSRFQGERLLDGPTQALRRASCTTPATSSASALTTMSPPLCRSPASAARPVRRGPQEVRNGAAPGVSTGPTERERAAYCQLRRKSQPQPSGHCQTDLQRGCLDPTALLPNDLQPSQSWGGTQHRNRPGVDSKTNPRMGIRTRRRQCRDESTEMPAPHSVRCPG